MQASAHWGAEDERALRAWFADYRDWLLQHPLAAREFRAKNNHGVWYDAQLIAYSHYLGHDETARRFLHHVRGRIDERFDASGAQPLELARTRSFFYSCYSLQAFFVAAGYGERLGVDLWRYDANDVASLRRALEFLVPYALDGEPWPYEELDDFDDARRELLPLLLQAAAVYPEAAFDADAGRLVAMLGDGRVPSADERLLFPPAVSCD